MKLSVSFFGSGQEPASPQRRYQNVLGLAEHADELGLHTLWVPERHFQDFGDLFPNPAVLAGALVSRTQRIRIHAGSIVLPLHDLIRVLEDWSILDTLSGGRIGVSVGTGWHPLDFVIRPSAFAERRNITTIGLGLLRSGWREGRIRASDPQGEQREVRIRPDRIQPELPLWLTTSGRRATWLSAGELGVSVLASTIGQTPESLAANIAAYRAAHHRHHPDGTPWVTLSVHTYLSDDRNEVRAKVETPMKTYLDSFVTQSASSERSGPADLSGSERAALLDFAFERYWSSLSMLGTPETCTATIKELDALGCDEVACLVDFGPSLPEMSRTLTLLTQTTRER
ncbi:natural product biosynthesis luciferase-like monooxygenase protein [Amycolatopsis sulphurea]|uniref:Natural product biosynthesis luciferase-like monooxygenase protein n=1 Tax=Amycolatopsis sulphurea TaxID=76022 RepID=A0A2A9G312_9PSEU|nr:MupA/Atu3671 family FMN-dependent luciferase-like monooxygenase [Amycolatopsis sulphurea]PFG57039.1 natural product biosynthesis luciferase-like monooxygenase protein [Amycolatopsis sulphurea]